ncbi:MAG: sodium:calcium antiporter [Candidatus Nealsonbacteria bacterium]|nr:sodium:calcium antiporter [Candidatus Nealsonbacteria bacterium]
MLLLNIIIFIFSCTLLLLMGKWVVDSLIGLAHFLQLREFVMAFFVMAFASCIPNFFVDISSALRGIPQLAFGDVVGGNVVDFTIAVGLAALISRGGITTNSRVVQSSMVFTFIIAILPLLLIWDGILGRADGVILISVFFIYIYWLFSKKERFSKVYQEKKTKKRSGVFLKDLIKLSIGVIVLLFAAQGIIKSSIAFSDIFNISLPLVGILIVGLGNALPEIYFSLIAAKKGQDWLILGDITGAVIIPATLVLGIVALISPIEMSGFSFSSFAVARFFMIASAIFFFFFVKTDKKITQKEGLFLLFLYIAFLICEIFFK